MTFPRICALSEVQWTNIENKNYNDFLARMDDHYLRLSEKGVNFRVPTPEGLKPIQVYDDKAAIIQLKNTVPSAQIRYTLDGSKPTPNSEIYEEPISVSLEEDVKIKAATFLTNGLKSKTVSSVLKRRKLKAYQIPRKVPGLNLDFYDGPFRSFKEIEGSPKISQEANWLVIPHNTIQKQKGWIFNGFIQIDSPGFYTFELSSSCGSGFYVDGELLIDNDGFFYTKGKQCSVQLKKGFYPITVKYFNSIYGSNLRLYYQRPGSEKMEVFPGEKYFRE
jgi:hexosaminidase